MHFCAVSRLPPDPCPLLRLRYRLPIRTASVRDIAAVWNCALLCRCASAYSCRAAINDLIDAITDTSPPMYR